MSAVFPPWSTHAFRAALALVAAMVFGVPALAMALARSVYVTNNHQGISQPVAFDHRHHVLDDGIDCRYCHTSVGRSAYAGMPPTAVCMGCHAQIWPDSSDLALVRESLAGGVPIAWKRVTTLPQYVYFDHHAHVGHGIGCSECHGHVERMARVEQATMMTMDWCLDCHRHPQTHLRPLDRITDITWQPTDKEQAVIGPSLVKALRIQAPVHCSGCHR